MLRILLLLLIIPGLFGMYTGMLIALDPLAIVLALIAVVVYGVWVFAPGGPFDLAVEQMLYKPRHNN